MSKKIKFGRGTSSSLSKLTKDADTLYFSTDGSDIYLGTHNLKPTTVENANKITGSVGKTFGSIPYVSNSATGAISFLQPTTGTTDHSSGAYSFLARKTGNLDPLTWIPVMIYDTSITVNRTTDDKTVPTSSPSNVNNPQVRLWKNNNSDTTIQFVASTGINVTGTGSGKDGKITISAKSATSSTAGVTKLYNNASSITTTTDDGAITPRKLLSYITTNGTAALAKGFTANNYNYRDVSTDNTAWPIIAQYTSNFWNPNDGKHYSVNEQWPITVNNASKVNGSSVDVSIRNLVEYSTGATALKISRYDSTLSVYRKTYNGTCMFIPYGTDATSTQEAQKYTIAIPYTSFFGSNVDNSRHIIKSFNICLYNNAGGNTMSTVNISQGVVNYWNINGSDYATITFISPFTIFDSDGDSAMPAQIAPTADTVLPGTPSQIDCYSEVVFLM